MAERILIVDDDEFMRTSLKTELEEEGFDVALAVNGTQAVTLAREGHFDLILCDVRMPDIDGIETITAIREANPSARVIFITAYASADTPVSALRLRVDDYLMKPFSFSELLSSIKAALVRLRQKESFIDGVARYCGSFMKIIRGVLFESKISHLQGHAEHVARFSLRIGRHLGLSPLRMQNLYLAALLHDIGYVELHPSLMEKREFEERDRELVKNHPVFARELLAPFRELREVATIIYCHHERWDGKGYPQGLSGEQIPVESRIIAIAEAYDSLTSARPHREKLDMAGAVSHIERESGKAFDGTIVETAKKILASTEKDDIEVLPVANEKHDGRISALLTLAELYLEAGDYGTAREAFSNAKELINEGASEELYARAEMGMSDLLSRQGRHEEALAMALDLLDYTAQRSLQLLQALAIIRASALRMELGRYDEVEKDLLLALKVLTLWESAPGKCQAELLLTALYALGGERDSRKFEEHLCLFVASPSAGQCFKAFTRYEALIHAILKRSMEKDAYLVEITALLAKAPGAAMKVLESLSEDRDFLVRERAGMILGKLSAHQPAGLPAGKESPQKPADTGEKASAASPRAPAGHLLKVFLFGAFRVSAGAAFIESGVWITQKTRSLFAFLASRLGEEVHEEKLIDLFWLEGGKDPRHSLHNSVSTIRKLVTAHLGGQGRSVIIHRQSTYCLNARLVDFVDYISFNDSYHRGMALLKEGCHEEAIAALQKAEGLYTGDFLESSYDEWSDEVRLMARNRHIELLFTLGKYFADKQKYEVGIGYFRKILTVDNICEDAYWGIMVSSIGLKNENEAIRSYQQCAKVLKREMDLPPPSKLTELYLSLIDRKPS
ncbi:MAG: response regulator [Candidatus Eremiobacteraeota bacterium]|nr:response regulator [Candidatus Eremiobacteraeota bacterium]